MCIHHSFSLPLSPVWITAFISLVAESAGAANSTPGQNVKASGGLITWGTNGVDMELRDAVEADAGRLASLTDTPRDVMRNLVHDRTVRIAERDGDIVGFVSYDARDQTIHVTQLEGEDSVYERLLEEPLRFARSEEMAVELLILDEETDVQDVATEMGFDRIGNGPSFEGKPTVRFRAEEP